MASLWCHMMNNDVYTHFSSIEEAYFFAHKLFTNSDKYCTIIDKLQTQSVVLLGSDESLQVSIYYGTNIPPVKKEWYPFGLSYIDKEDLKKNKEYTNRMSLVLDDEVSNTKRSIYTLRKSASHTEFLDKLCQ